MFCPNEPGGGFQQVMIGGYGAHYSVHVWVPVVTFPFCRSVAVVVRSMRLHVSP
ncbi:hypothetical protein P171DRAFT_436073 [Karstenula rhodostoma CBS 690.94]|uniref:Uncharacterized protein n=1 Tax=Karstenula rhodostoma CBS 690.94 TaxID=1392251 RepID=A0A9P4PA05_9PLEO|nr:hypothetical protein P171DRAFT_436073 [Karstenula rhodostoma CBS 690.94]